MTDRYFTIDVEVDSRYAPSLREMTDLVADGLERRGATLQDYSVVVTGPPELRIGFR